MSLQGTLDTFSLPDVLRFLAASGKTGRLVLTGPRGGGDVWLDDGAVVAAETEQATDMVDALFDLMRDLQGSFTFESDLTRSDGDEPQPVDEVVAKAESRLSEWQEIESVVPSLSVEVRLSDDVPGGAVRIESAQWKALVAVAESGRAGAVADRLGLGEFDACRTLKELAERGLVIVGDASSAPAASLEEPGDAQEPEPAPVELTDEPPATAKAAKAAEVVEAAEADAPEKVRTTRQEPAPSTTLDDEMVTELENLGPEAAAAVQAAARATTDEERAQALAGIDEDDPSRGLLLKFLSSVRT